jgi:hypothetical protein
MNSSANLHGKTPIGFKSTQINKQKLSILVKKKHNLPIFGIVYMDYCNSPLVLHHTTTMQIIYVPLAQPHELLI